MSQESFRAFGSYGHTEAETSRSWFSSLAASSVIYVGIALLVLSIPVTQRIVEKRKEVEIKFVEKVVKPSPSPPPPVQAPRIEPPKPAIAKPAPPAGLTGQGRVMNQHHTKQSELPKLGESRGEVFALNAADLAGRDKGHGRNGRR